MNTGNRRVWRGIGPMLAVVVLVAGCGGGGSQDGASAGSDVLQKGQNTPARAPDASPGESEDPQVGSEAARKAVTPDLTLLALEGTVVNATTAGDQQAPRIAPLAEGGYVVAWSTGSSSSIQRYDAQGQKLGGEQSIGSGSAITGLRNGGYMVGYSARGSESTLSIRSYAADGLLLTDRTLDSVPIFSGPSQRQTFRLLFGLSFLYVADGGAAVWIEGISTPWYGVDLAKLQRYDGAGLPIGSTEFIGYILPTAMSHGGYLLGKQIFDRTGTYRGDLPSDLQSIGVAIDSMGDGGYSVAWVSQNHLYAQRLTANGSPVGGRTSVGPVASSSPYRQVVALSDNSFVVIWATGDPASLRAQRFDVNGNPAGDVLPIQPPLPYTTSAERGVAVAPLSDGGFAVAWTVTSAQDGADVYTQRFVEARVGTTTRDWLAGTEGRDVLHGLAGADRIWGLGGDDWIDGGEGADTMAGGPGDDTYIVDNEKDKVVERQGEGHDRVYSSVHHRLDRNVEDLFLTGSAPLNGRGNELDNHIVGNAGANLLEGGAGDDYLQGGDGDDVLVGGPGNDKLDGGAGRDMFVFDEKPGLDNIDVIVKFSVTEDIIQLRPSIFHGLKSRGPLSVDAFAFGTAATNAATRILYNPATGALLYDPDGAGGQAAVQIATLLAPSGTLSAANFVVH